MSKYSYIAAEFAKYGYSDSARLNEYEINAALDKIVQHNMPGMPEFERDVAEELYQQSKKDREGYVVLRDYINVILQAHTVLQKHIANHREELKGSNNEDKKVDIRAAIQQFEEDLRILTQPFHLHNSLPSRSASQKLLAGASPMAKSQAGPVAEVGLQKSGILAMQTSDNVESQSLVWVLIIAGLAMPFQLLNAFVKHHFLNIMAILMILSIFLLNYFDKLYIRGCIVALAASFVLDFFWLIGLSGDYWSPGPSHRSIFRAGFLRYTVVMTVILMIAHLLLGFLIYRYKNNKPQTRKSVKLGPLKFDLSGDGASNPLTMFFSKKNEMIGGLY